MQNSLAPRRDQRLGIGTSRVLRLHATIVAQPGSGLQLTVARGGRPVPPAHGQQSNEHSKRRCFPTSSLDVPGHQLAPMHTPHSPAAALHLSGCVDPHAQASRPSSGRTTRLAIHEERNHARLATCKPASSAARAQHHAPLQRATAQGHRTEHAARCALPLTSAARTRP